MRTLKVEAFDQTWTARPATKALIRLKGKWLAQLFPPNSRVEVQVRDGQLVISPIRKETAS